VSALLDVNVLLALALPTHVHHRRSTEWFLEHGPDGWATCPATEAGFVRLSLNGRLVKPPRSAPEAIAALRALRDQPGHEFWIDDVALATAVEVDTAKVRGHQQVTDVHLLALAHRRGGRLVSFDRGLVDLVPGAEVELLTLAGD
jgi:toxin-antitoxin system PIN domain toxin